MDSYLLLTIYLIVILWLLTCIQAWIASGSIGWGLLWGTISTVALIVIGGGICALAYLWGYWIFFVAIVLLVGLAVFLVRKLA